MPDALLYTNLLAAKQRGEKRLAVLIDPETAPAPPGANGGPGRGMRRALFFYRRQPGSQRHAGCRAQRYPATLRHSPRPVSRQFLSTSYRADALLFLSLISGRNPELLIGQHVISAPFLKMSPLEMISTGYLLIDGGVQTAVQYMSNTYPIPANKDDIAVCTALAGEMLGLKMIYLDAGSGAEPRARVDDRGGKWRHYRAAYRRWRIPARRRKRRRGCVPGPTCW